LQRQRSAVTLPARAAVNERRDWRRKWTLDSAASPLNGLGHLFIGTSDLFVMGSDAETCWDGDVQVQRNEAFS